MPLVKLAPLDPPVPDLGWLVPGQNISPLRYDVCRRALKDVGILEVPLGSNRGTRIDRYAKAAGSPLGSWWCAILAGRVLIDAGSLVPAEYGLTDNWLPYVERADRGAKPEVGDVVIYGLKRPGPVVSWGDGHHAGIIVRLPEPGQNLTLTIEGNRGFAGTTNNGVAVDIGPMVRSDVLGYFKPRVA